MAELAKKRNRNHSITFLATAASTNNTAAAAAMDNNHMTNKNMPLNNSIASTPMTAMTTSRPTRTKLSSKMRRFVRNLSNPPSFPVLHTSFQPQPPPPSEQQTAVVSIILPAKITASNVAPGGNIVLRDAGQVKNTESDSFINNEKSETTVAINPIVAGDEQQQQRGLRTKVFSGASTLPPLPTSNGINHQQQQQQQQQQQRQRNHRRRLRHFTVINFAESIRNRLSGHSTTTTSAAVGGCNHQQQQEVINAHTTTTTKRSNANDVSIISDACSKLAHGNSNDNETAAAVRKEQRTAGNPSSNFFNIVESSSKKQTAAAAVDAVASLPCPKSIKSITTPRPLLYEQELLLSYAADKKQQQQLCEHDTLRDNERQHDSSSTSAAAAAPLTHSGNQSFANFSFPVNTSTFGHSRSAATATSFFLKCDYNKKSNPTCCFDEAETSLQDIVVAPHAPLFSLDTANSCANRASTVIHHQHRGGEDEGEAANNVINSKESTITSNELRPPSQSLLLAQHASSVSKNHHSANETIAQHFQHVIQGENYRAASTAPNDAGCSFLQYSSSATNAVQYPDFVLQGAKLTPSFLLAQSTPHLSTFRPVITKPSPPPTSNFTVICKQRVHVEPLAADHHHQQHKKQHEQLPQLAAAAKRFVKRHPRGAPHRQTICTSQIVVSTVKYNHAHHSARAAASQFPTTATQSTATSTTLPHELPEFFSESVNTTRPSSSAAVSSAAQRRQHHFHSSTTRLSNSIQHLLTALGGRNSSSAGGGKHGSTTAEKAMAFASPFYTANKVSNYYGNMNNDSNLPDSSNETSDFAADEDLRAHMAGGATLQDGGLKTRAHNGRFAATSASSGGGAEESSFIHKYLQGSVTRQTPECLYARTGDQLPVYVLRPFSRQLRACITGPVEGVANIPFLGALSKKLPQPETSAATNPPRPIQPRRNGAPAWQAQLAGQDQHEKQHQISAVTRALLFANRKETLQLALEDFIALLLRDEVTSSRNSWKNSSAIDLNHQQVDFRQERRQSDDNVSLTREGAANLIESATTTGEESTGQYEDKPLAEQKLRKATSDVSVTHVGAAPTAVIEELNENLGAVTPSTFSATRADNGEATPVVVDTEDDKTPTNNVLSLNDTITAKTPTEDTAAVAMLLSTENNSSASSATTRTHSSSSAAIMSAPEAPLILHEAYEKEENNNISADSEQPTVAVGQHSALDKEEKQLRNNSSFSPVAVGNDATAAAAAANTSESSELEEDESGYAEKEAASVIDSKHEEEESYSSAPEMRQLTAAATAHPKQTESIFQSHHLNGTIPPNFHQQKPSTSAAASLPLKPPRSAPRPLRHQHNSIASSTPASAAQWQDRNHQNQIKCSAENYELRPSEFNPRMQYAATQIIRGENFIPRMTLPFPTINPEEDTPTYHWLPPPPAHADDELPNTPVTWPNKLFGISRSLYERNIHVTANTVNSTETSANPLQLPPPVRSGDPIADTFAAVAMDNGGILVIADGVNWGEKARLAARCAIKGALDFLLASINSHGYYVWTTKDLFSSITLAFHAAHNLILQEHATLTTLCLAVVLPAFAGATPDEQAQLNRSAHKQYVVCVANVGDSFAYVYSARSGVREITIGSHDVYSMRDMRDALGALGPVDEHFPELANFTCSLTFVDAGDIVFLCSDGISDNFDPVVGKFCVMRDAIAPSSSNTGKISLPTVEAYQRHELMLLRMEDLLFNGITPGCNHDERCRGARQLCTSLVTFAEKMTAAKRHILEDPDLYPAGRLSRAQQRLYRRKACERLALIPGKLDHATVVAYQAGQWNADYSQVFDSTAMPNWVPPPAAAVIVQPQSASASTVPLKRDAGDATEIAAGTAAASTEPHLAGDAEKKKIDLAKADSLMSLAIDDDLAAAARRTKEVPKVPPPPYLAGLAQRLEELALQQQQFSTESDTNGTASKPPSLSRSAYVPTAVVSVRPAVTGHAILIKNPNDDDTTIVIERNGKIVISI